MNAELRAKCDRLQHRAFVLGLICLVLSIADGIRAPEQFFRSYLLGFVFWIGLPLGCAAFLMIHYLTGGDWGLPIKQPLEAGARTLPLLLLLVIPLLFGLPYLFSWTHAEQVAADPTLRLKHFYLNVPFFLVREVIYFTVWLWTAYQLAHWSSELHRTHDPIIQDRLERMSGPGLVVYAFTITFFSIDWMMSLDPYWFSTIFGMIVMVIQVQVAIAFVILVAHLLGKYEPLSSAMSAPRFNDLGNLLLTFVMLWAYLAFSQFLIIWSGNLFQEIRWYVSRASNGWGMVAVALIIFFFAAPFVLLLMRGIKRRVALLSAVSAVLIFLSFVDIYWMIVPSFYPSGPRFYLLDFLLPVAMGGCWLAFYIQQLKNHPLLPAVIGPLLKESSSGD